MVELVRYYLLALRAQALKVVAAVKQRRAKRRIKRKGNELL